MKPILFLLLSTTAIGAELFFFTCPKCHQDRVQRPTLIVTNGGFTIPDAQVTQRTVSFKCKCRYVFSSSNSVTNTNVVVIKLP